MRFPVIVCPWLKVSGMAVFPFILVSSKQQKEDSSLILHEKIHLYQQLELLIFPFYLLYLLNYLVNYTRYKKRYNAYMNIVFEKEAYANDNNPDYLSKRKFWAFLLYL